MSEQLEIASAAQNAIARLASLAPLAPGEFHALELAAQSSRAVPARRDVFSEQKAVAEPLIILSGWGCRVRILRDGRRQILGFLLPGDLLGHGRHNKAVAVTPTMALTELVVCPAPLSAPGSAGTGLSAAYAASGALDEHYLLAQITRLGRMSAFERIADWLLELHERLTLVKLATGPSFKLPATQEIIADALGLTSVHVNRTLQAMRRDGLLEVRGGTVTLLDKHRLATVVDYQPACAVAA